MENMTSFFRRVSLNYVSLRCAVEYLNVFYTLEPVYGMYFYQLTDFYYKRFLKRVWIMGICKIRKMILTTKLVHQIIQAYAAASCSYKSSTPQAESFAVALYNTIYSI